MNRMAILPALGALLCAVALALPDANLPTDVVDRTQPKTVTGTSEGVLPPSRTAAYGDVPPGYQARAQATMPAPDEMPVALPAPATDYERSNGGIPLWGPDVQVYSGDLVSPLGGPGSERMLSTDYATNGHTFVAFPQRSDSTVRLYRSTDEGATWAYWAGLIHTGNVLSSPELVVAEGDSDFVFLFVKSTAGNGDVYMGRWPLAGGSALIVPVLTGTDTIANCAATADLEGQYYLHLTFEQITAGPEYNVHTRRSTDYGKTWHDNGGDVVDTRITPRPDISYGAGGNLYLLLNDIRQSPRPPDTASFRIKRSTNRGTSWLPSYHIGTPIVDVFNGVVGANHRTAQTIWVVHVRNMDPFNGMGLGVFYYYSTNSGVNWYYGGDDGIGGIDTDNNERLPSISCNKSLGAPTVSFGLVPSESLMFTWCPGDTNWTTPIKINDHRHTGNFAPAAGWKRMGSSLYSTVAYAGVGPTDVWFDAWDFPVGVEEPGPVPAVAPAAVSVSPNPAKRQAAVSFTLTRPAEVNLGIFDVTGRRLATLAQGVLPARQHELSWDASSVPAGIYFCRLESDAVTTTAQLVIAR